MPAATGFRFRTDRPSEKQMRFFRRPACRL